MLEIRKTTLGFSLYLHNTCLLNDTAVKPLLKLGTAKGSFSSPHGSYHIRESDLVWYSLPQPVIYAVDKHLLNLAYQGYGTLSIALHAENTVQFSFSLETDKPINRFQIAFPLDETEPIYGCGEQYSFVDLRALAIPIWVQEQGLGRGPNLVKLCCDIVAGAGGSRYSTYFSMPAFVTRSRAFAATSYSYARFDFRQNGVGILQFWQIPQTLSLTLTSSLAESVGALSQGLGRQGKLPSWVGEGISLGVQGGREAVLAKLAAFDTHAPGSITSLWIQDWVGKRITSFGSQLLWNWEYHKESYPAFPQFIREMNERGIRVLGYINPYLAMDCPMYQEASGHGYCVKNQEGGDYAIRITTFDVAIIDLTNSEARTWIKSVIKKHMIGIGLSGWMADFAEFLPTDCILSDASDPEITHNLYPVLWAQVNREAIEEAGKRDECFFFSRSGYLGSASVMDMSWAGDQMVNWDRDDGLASVVPAALSLGLCGIPYWHSDMGGYTTLGWVKRRRDLAIRWAELAVFAPFMRSHEGNKPERNVQYYEDEALIKILGFLARLHNALHPYLITLEEEYQQTGLPFIRVMSLAYPEVKPMRTQFLYGPDVLVAPVLKRGVAKVKVYIPDDSFTSAYDDKAFGKGWHTVSAPLGKPVFFVKKGSLVSRHITAFLALEACMADSSI
ncbi:alpha-glucosidase [uncultured Sphaerochaeta sp.]|uniref:alpha-glucosidase n=1 Tax=uncultured Sphaerochaeta sp. TaxID=886478 RepID=UPI0029CA35E9|nr:alpha-glucosidase [uncultured Sphaerochaeta sp.]